MGGFKMCKRCRESKKKFWPGNKARIRGDAPCFTPVTERQLRALRFIASCRLPPSLRELCEELDMVSTNAASELLHTLRRKGMVEMVPAVARGVLLTEAGRKLATLPKDVVTC